MNKLRLLLSIGVFVFISSTLFATVHNVAVANNTFTPANLAVNVGDAIVWTLTAGTHTTTSTTVPAGAATWNYTFAGVGDTYTYYVTVAGNYTYECLFHPGMVGEFTAVLGGFPFIEEFEYSAGDSLINLGWNLTNSTVNPITVVSPSLTYPGYPSSGIGNAASLTTSGQDLNKQFEPVTSGAVYASVLVNVSSAQAPGDYFYHLGLANTTSILLGRVFVKLGANGNLAFGLSKSSTNATVPPVYSDSIYTTGTTYLIVLKYQFNPDVADDTVSLFINPAITSVEPAANLVHGTLTTGSDPANIGGVYLRQGSASNSANVVVDGIRVSSTWIETVLPVELVSFNASVSGSSVSLKWITASEINNSGFQIERKSTNTSWQNIGFIQGYGTTAETKSYFFADKNLQPGKYSYRLKQIDFDGSYQYSNEVAVDIANVPVKFDLAQNFPNPFNPSTTINFSIPQATNVSLKVYNMLGQEVKTLINGFKDAGTHTIKFDAKDLNSGLYFYKLEAGSFNMVKKMTLLK